MMHRKYQFTVIGGRITKTQLINGGWSFRHIHNPPKEERQQILVVSMPRRIQGDLEKGGNAVKYSTVLAHIHGQPSFFFFLSELKSNFKKENYMFF